MSECKHEWYLKSGRGYLYCGVCGKTVPVENHIDFIEQENSDLRAKLEAAKQANKSLTTLSGREVELIIKERDDLRRQVEQLELIIGDAMFLCETFLVHDYPELECRPLIISLSNKIEALTAGDNRYSKIEEAAKRVVSVVYNPNRAMVLRHSKGQEKEDKHNEFLQDLDNVVRKLASELGDGNK